jgi:oligopeptide transport system permease protein
MAVRSDVLRVGAGGVPLTRRRESLWADAFRRLLRNRAAVLGGITVILLL